MKVRVFATFEVDLPEGHPDNYHKDKTEAKQYVEEWLLSELAMFMEMTLGKQESARDPYYLVKDSVTTFLRKEFIIKPRRKQR